MAEVLVEEELHAAEPTRWWFQTTTFLLLNQFPDEVAASELERCGTEGRHATSKLAGQTFELHEGILSVARLELLELQNVHFPVARGVVHQSLHAGPQIVVPRRRKTNEAGHLPLARKTNEANDFQRITSKPSSKPPWPTWGYKNPSDLRDCYTPRDLMASPKWTSLLHMRCASILP